VKSSLHPNYGGDLKGVGCDNVGMIWLAVGREA